MQETINLRKKREFGEVFNATILFLKQEYKLLGKAFLYYVLPVSIVIAIISSYSQVSMMRNLNLTDSRSILANYGNNFPRYMIIYLLMIINQAVLLSLVLGYLRLYLEKGSGNFQMKDILEMMKASFVRMLLAMLLVFVIVMVGLILCVIPGVYLGVSLSVIFCIIMFENRSIGEAFSRSFELTRIQWWWTFLIIFVSTVIVALIIYILAIPAGIFGLSIGMHQIKNPGTLPESMGVLFVIYNSVMAVITYILYIIPFTVIAFQYFNLVEIKERPSLLEKIDLMSNEGPKAE
jgi:hypothetical protein